MSYRDERRAHPRARVKVRVGIAGGDGAVRGPLHTVDLSLGGCRCLGHAEAGVGDLLTGRLFLPLSEGGRDLEVEVAFEARVLRVRDVGRGPGRLRELAIAFTRVAESDQDELRRYLLEWLANDSLVRDSLVETA